MGNTSPGEIRIDTDVLVLGAGAAGCLAAYGAKEQGIQNVTLVDKGALSVAAAPGQGRIISAPTSIPDPSGTPMRRPRPFTADQDGVWGTPSRRRPSRESWVP